MNLFFRSDTLALVSSPQFLRSPQRVEVVRGDTPEIRVQFVDPTTLAIVDPFGAGASWLFAAKAVGSYDAPPLVATDAVTRVVVGTSPNEVVTYVFAPSFSTEGLNTALGVGDAADVAYVDLNAQFQATVGGTKSSTIAFSLRVNNDVARDEDLLPTPLAPVGVDGGAPNTIFA